jgi:NitT/TauT family transport system substrate-binding protein
MQERSPIPEFGRDNVPTLRAFNLTWFRLRSLTVAAFALLFGAIAPMPVATAEEQPEFRLSRQPGLVFLQNLIMEDKKLLEKHAERLGLKDLKVQWLQFTSGGVSTEALLSGQVDIVTSGLSNMLLIWSKTNGSVKALSGVAGTPMTLLTRNPNIKSLKDFGPNDRIAVPTLKQSMQSTVLGIALDQVHGPGNHGKLDDIQVQLGHPEATQALLNASHEINSHFSNTPFADIALRSEKPKIYQVLSSVDVLGGPAHVSCAYAAQKFVDANPLKVQAFLAALDEASELVAKDPRAAVASYLAASKDKASAEVVHEIVTRAGNVFQATPVRTMIYADQLSKTGLIKTKPASWKDYHFPIIHARSGS